MDVGANIIVSGRVQGVCFRYGTKKQALARGLKGWVKNNYDNSVEVLAYGDKKKIKELIEWCHKGPSLAHVEDVKVEWLEYNEKLSTFKMKY